MKIRITDWGEEPEHEADSEMDAARKAILFVDDDGAVIMDVWWRGSGLVIKTPGAYIAVFPDDAKQIEVRVHRGE